MIFGDSKGFLGLLRDFWIFRDLWDFHSILRDLGIFFSIFGMVYEIFTSDTPLVQNDGKRA